MDNVVPVKLRHNRLISNRNVPSLSIFFILTRYIAAVRTSEPEQLRVQAQGVIITFEVRTPVRTLTRFVRTRAVRVLARRSWDHLLA